MFDFHSTDTDDQVYCESVFPFVVVILTRNNMRRGTKRSRTSVTNEKRLAAAGETFHHSVYVILLDRAVVRHPSILRLNPNREPAKPCVYVGMTGLLVEHRFVFSPDGRRLLTASTSRTCRAVHIKRSRRSSLVAAHYPPLPSPFPFLGFA